jgi:lysophospholipase L1-like esterase
MRITFFILFFCQVLTSCKSQSDSSLGNDTVNYVALGDSYTICTGAQRYQAWPTILTKHLNEQGIKAELIANPARNGYTTKDLIAHELKVLDEQKVNFVTLCIGVNDWVQGVPISSFRENLINIIEYIQTKLEIKSKLLLLTIPDFSCTLVGPQYGGGRNISEGIAEFNSVILEEAKKRNLKTVDLFEISKEMKNDPSLIASDGLHPSAKEYAIWEAKILPIALDLLK